MRLLGDKPEKTFWVNFCEEMHRLGAETSLHAPKSPSNAAKTVLARRKKAEFLVRFPGYSTLSERKSSLWGVDYIVGDYMGLKQAILAAAMMFGDNSPA